MARLPDEIWTDVLDYLDPHDIISTQRVSSHLYKLARDARLWRYKCFEKAPSAAQSRSERPNALSTLTGALGVLSLDGAPPPAPPTSNHHIPQQSRVSRRAIAVTEWDCSDPTEGVNWYSEYMGRHAPLSVDWADDGKATPEVRGMALYRNGEKVVGPLDDGSVRIWDVERSSNRRPRLTPVSTSKAGLLFQDFSQPAESSTKKQLSLGYAVENIAIDSSRRKAYVAANEFVNEVDLERMVVISQHKYAWPVTALSQDTSDLSFSLTIGTSWSLHLHDHRTPLGSPSYWNDPTTKLDGINGTDPTIAFLPNYAKLDSNMSVNTGGFASIEEQREYFDRIPRGGLRAYARVEPGPQSIIHRGTNEIVIAGRMPSILFYDHRFFPKPKLSIHSGARLSAMTTLPFAPVGDKNHVRQQETLIACGEYGGCGSLEIYGLDAADSGVISLSSRGEHGPSTNDHYQDSHLTKGTESAVTPTQSLRYSYKNRQTASSSKLLSVCIQGTRIVFSDAEGQLKWVERDGRGLARRWNINAASYSISQTSRMSQSNFSIGQYGQMGSTNSISNHNSLGAGISSNTDAVRKMIPLSLPQSDGSQKIAQGDDDILVWTGEKIGIVTCKSHWDSSWSHDDLVRAFESKMNLSGSSDDDNTDGELEGLSEDERNRRNEAEYARQMRRALERQADERRWMSRFGGRWR